MNNKNDITAQFAKAVSDMGLQLKAPPIMDGRLYRVPVIGDSAGQTSGAYVGHLVGRKPGGYIENFKTGEKVNWKASGPTPELSPAERARLAIESEQRRKERDAAISAEHEATATAARQLWNESWIAKNTNPYCVVKNIIDPIGLREVPSNVTPHCASLGIKIVKTALEAKAAREADPRARVFKTGDLLVPGRDADGKLWTLQSINPSFKSLMKGGKKRGLFAVAGTNDRKTALQGSEPLIIAEGFATANTVSRLLDQPVIAAFDSGNLDAVIGELDKLFPERPILIAADNDHSAPINVGLDKAREAATKYGCGVMVPPFKGGDKGSDWNDFAAANGDTVTRLMLKNRMSVAMLAPAMLPTTKVIFDNAAIKAKIDAAFVRQSPIKKASHERGGEEYGL